ncbi:MAG: OmpA family protein [Bryobacteraceae bacterium]
MRALHFGKSPAIFGAAVVLVFATTGCATKKHVRGVVAPVEARVGTVEQKTADNTSAIGELENNVSRVDEKVLEVDKKAAAAGQDAAKAQQAADQAGTQAQQAGTQAKGAQQLAEQTRTRLSSVVENMDNYKMVANESVLFNLNQHTLTDEARQTLDAAIANLKSARNYIIEVQGFTDTTGSPATNLALSQRRADSVVRYLTVEHDVPLRKIHVLGVGAASPAADNKTREGRKQNRRVELKVFAVDFGTAGQDSAQASTANNE